MKRELPMLKKLSLALLVFFICLGPVTVCESKNRHASGNDLYRDAIKVAREAMWKVVTSGGGDGVTVAIADKGEIVYAEGIGVADRSENRLVNTDTRFNIGSTSKMFAAVAILLLVDDGSVGLDEPVVKYIPEFRMKDPRYKDITVRMLFNHSSGIPGSTFYFGYDVNPNMHKYVLDTLAESYLKHAPGAMPIYCNDGFTLAEIIVEKVSGEKFVDFLARRVFKPLGMKYTGASIGEIKAKNSAEHYGPENGKKYPLETVMVYGAGGLSSTASDLCRFVSSFSPYGKKILSAASLKEILKTQPTPFGAKLRGLQMGSDFGWDYSRLPAYEEKGIQVLAKSGGTACFSTYMQTAPEYGVTVAFSICGHGCSMEPLSRKILDAVMRAKNVTVPEPESVKKPVEAAETFPEELLGYAGFYASGIEVVKVSFDKENKKFDLVPLADEKSPKEKVTGPAQSFIYKGGYFFCNENKTQVYFTTIDGQSYIMIHPMQDYGMETPYYQKIEKLSEPKSLRVDVSGKTWLVRSASQHCMESAVEPVESRTYAELPGYLYFEGLKKTENPEYAGFAANGFRDQTAFAIIDRNGETWAKSSMNLYSMADNARKLINGVNRVIIKSENYNEWLKVEKGAIVNFEKPESARIIVVAESGPIYDSVVDNKEIYAPAGSFIFFAGCAGDIFRIEAR